MYRLNLEVLPSLIIVLMGSIDAATTVVGTLYFGATELNPLLTGLVSTNITGFLVLKLLASFCIGATYVLVKRMMNMAEDKSSKSFKFGTIFMKISYASVIAFLIIVVVNNLIVILA